MIKILLIIISCISFICDCDSARILGVFPVTSISHQIVFRPVMRELANRGHEVVVITPNPARSDLKNLKEIDVGKMSYAIVNNTELLTVGKYDRETELIRLFELFNIITEEQLKADEVKELINTQHFDILIWECISRMALIFSHLLNIPVIGISSLAAYLDLYQTIGANDHPILNPQPFSFKTLNLTITETAAEFFNYYIRNNIYENMEVLENKMLNNIFGAELPELKDLKPNIKLLFLNNHPIWDFNRPVPRSVLYLSNLSEKQLEPLPQDLQNFLDSSANGVIYLSFGSNYNTNLFSNNTVKIFTQVFSELKYDVLMRWDAEDTAGLPKNIKISKWLPQSDLLRHPKVKLFITQGGLQSTDEAITGGVPLIGLPLRGDQWYNVQNYEHHKIGLQLELHSLTEEMFMNAIQTVITNNSYRENILKLRNIMRDQQMNSVERAVLWTEYILKSGNTDLRGPAAGVTWTEYYEIELVFYGFVIFILMLSILIYYVKKFIIMIISKIKIKTE